jgi:hypothetical protein
VRRSPSSGQSKPIVWKCSSLAKAAVRMVECAYTETSLFLRIRRKAGAATWTLTERRHIEQPNHISRHWEPPQAKTAPRSS